MRGEYESEGRRKRAVEPSYVDLYYLFFADLVATKLCCSNVVFPLFPLKGHMVCRSM